MDENQVVPHMVKQIIVYSDGTEKVINYRGVIVNGVLTPDVIEEGVAEVVAEESAPAEAPVEEAVETPVEETPADEEVSASEEV